MWALVVVVQLRLSRRFRVAGRAPRGGRAARGMLGHQIIASRQTSWSARRAILLRPYVTASFWLFRDFHVFCRRDFKPQTLLLFGGFEIQLFRQHVAPVGTTF